MYSIDIIFNSRNTLITSNPHGNMSSKRPFIVLVIANSKSNTGYKYIPLHLKNITTHKTGNRDLALIGFNNNIYVHECMH